MRECPFSIGSYRAEESLIHSAAGVLYRARRDGWAGSAPHYAGLFLLDPETARDGVVLSRFREGVERSVGLSHPNLMQVHEFGEEKGEPFVLTDWLPGRTIERFSGHLRARGRPWPVAQAITVAVEVAKALAFLQSFRDPLTGSALQLNHGYVRPKSIFVTYGGVIKLVPLPIAWCEAQAERQRIPDTVYSAPEQVLGWEIDARSDLFSLGVVLWEMITGTLLFQAASEDERKRLLFEQPIDPPSSRESSVPPELDKVVLRMLDRDPYLRYQTTDEVIRDLSAVLKFRFGNEAQNDLATFCQEEFRELREADLSGVQTTSHAESETRVLDLAEKTGGGPAPAPKAIGGSSPDDETVADIQVAGFTNPTIRTGSNPGLRAPERSSVPERIKMERGAPAQRQQEGLAPAAWAKPYARQEEDFDWKRTVLIAGLVIIGITALVVGLRRTKFGSKSAGPGLASVAQGTEGPKEKIGKAVFLTDEEDFAVEVDGTPVELSEEFEVPVPMGVPVYIRVHKLGYEDIIIDRTFSKKGDFLIELKFKKAAASQPAHGAHGSHDALGG